MPTQAISYFDKLWLQIEPAVQSNTLNFWQTIYKEIYSNLIKDDRWLQYLNGLSVTIKVSFFSIIFGVVLGLILALLRLPEVKDIKYRKTNSALVNFFKYIGISILKLLSKFAGFYIQLYRGTPLLLQVLIINFGIFGTVRVDKIVIGVIACGLNSAAYVAEIIRGGLISVPHGQKEAGRSLGLSAIQTLNKIIIPQALKSALPAMGNEFIALIKETSILSYIALTELTKAGDYIRSRTYSAFTPYIISGLLYLVCTLTLTKLISKLEKRLSASDLH
ncbi:MAG: amino acid ABC transporter permease [Christensenellaceae bacterium]|nr:amino acid ABC transporter permease [Christensenellaceae bacterium]